MGRLNAAGRVLKKRIHRVANQVFIFATLLHVYCFRFQTDLVPTQILSVQHKIGLEYNLYIGSCNLTIK